MASEEPLGAGNCKYHPVDGKAWVQLGDGYPHGKSLWRATPMCKSISPGGKTLYPVSGGIRFEGIWNDISIGEKWRLVQSQVYDPDNLPLSGWSCMVERTGPARDKDNPGAIWCSVLCCPQELGHPVG